MTANNEEGLTRPIVRERRDFSIAPWVSILILGGGILIFYLISLNFYALPTPLLRSDEAENQDKFIAERARNMLEEFNQIGVKVVGSKQNEVLAIEFLQRKFDDLLRDMNPVHSLEYSRTSHSDSYQLDHAPHAMIEWYQDIQNVQIRLSPASMESSGATLLVNSHFDTVPVSPGMSDAGIMIIIMLETIRVLTKSSTPLRHNVVFLFNGAEEAGLCGAHAFITKHPWRHNITGLINLDATGAGGKEILFQAGPDSPWLANLYVKHAPHPYASAMGEELFQMNVIPSDTDFRIFRDYGGIKGLDLAYSYNGYVYHTKFDNLENIPFGTYQHTGANVLALTREMANSEDLDLGVDHRDDESVFFDYLSWFAISYSKLVSIIVNVLVGLLTVMIALASIRSMCKDCDYSFATGLKEFVYILLIQAGSVIIGIGLAILFAVIYDAVGRSLSYYSNSWLVFGLYWLPVIVGLCVGPIVYFRVNKNKTMDQHYQLQMWMHANACLLTLVLILLTIFGIRTAFVILIPVVFYAFTMTINFVFGFQKKVHIWLPIVALGQLFPFMFFSQLSLIFFTTFIPMQARGGSSSNPEFIICAFSFLMAWIMTGFFTPLIGCMRKDLWVMGGLGALIVATIIMVATPLGFPYTAVVSPQRHWIFHSQRNLYGLNGELRESGNGYLLLPMDRHSHPENLLEKMEIMRRAEPNQQRCEEELFCGMPFYSTRMLNNAKDSFWIPAEKPYLNKEVTFRRILNGQPANRLAFEVDATSALGVFLSPMPGVEIEKWSFFHLVTDFGVDFQNRKTYFINLSAGIPAPATFWIDLNVPNGWTGKKIDIGVAGHYSYFDDERTKEFQEFIDSFPQWCHVTAWMASYDGYEF